MEQEGPESGARVGAIHSNKAGYLIMFGYGTYIGNYVPTTEDVKFMGVPLLEMGLPSPCIQLDSGEYIYGCECWWGSEEKVKRMEEEADNVEYTTPQEFREDNEL